MQSTYIILLNWNSSELTLKLAQSLTPSIHKIIIIDNASSDGSTSILENIPGITLLRSSQNLGFAGGNNIAIRYALEKGAEYIWLLNNDTEPKEGALEEMLKISSKNSDLGIVGSTLLNSDQSVQCYGGSYLNPWVGNMRHITTLDNLHKLNYLCAASLLIPRKIFESCGLLDERFFLYWEDSEFSWRVKSSGFSLLLAEKSFVSHQMGLSTNKVPHEKVFYYNKSSLLFARVTKQKTIIFWGIFLRLLKATFSLKIKNVISITQSILSKPFPPDP